MTAKLTPKQLKLVAALATDDDVQAACAATGVGRTTAYRWLKDPEVQSALAQHREQSFSAALNSLKSKASRAVDELDKLLTVSDERLRRLVCNDILLFAWRVREQEDFERRLSALEKRAEIRGHRPETDGEANENRL